MKRLYWVWLVWLLSTMVGCQTAGPTPLAPTTTPLGILEPFGTPFITAAVAAAGEPTATAAPLPQPRRTYPCFAPLMFGEQEQETFLYQFDWQATTESLNIPTRAGEITLTARATFSGGKRWLAITHLAPLPSFIALPDDFEPGATLLLDPLHNAYEMRSPSGNVQRQWLLDPPEDVRGLPPNLDLVSVEKQFGSGGYILRVTTTEPDDQKYIWSYEAFELTLGGAAANERYVHRIMAQGSPVNLYYNQNGKYSTYTGSIITQANTVTWAFDQSDQRTFSVRTLTSAASGDSVPSFPVDLLQALWERQEQVCR
jgi:hypothetical protein